MKKVKTYKSTKFQPDIISEASNRLLSYIPEDVDIRESYHNRISDISWHYDSEAEFFADYRQDISYANYSKRNSFSSKIGEYQLDLTFDFSKNTDISVTAPMRNQIESVFEVFERNAHSSIIKIEKIENKPTIFIGHGGSGQWRDLKDHLHEKHGYSIQAYEVAARAGHAIRDILEHMLDASSFAILVMTGEDKDSEGKLHPRENVIHELGLFQGSLGFSKVIILLEEGVEEFSNIHGIHQIRYSKGKIKETFGEVLATLKREFG